MHYQIWGIEEQNLDVNLNADKSTCMLKLKFKIVDYMQFDINRCCHIYAFVTGD